jgi:hypothetical protein
MVWHRCRCEIQEGKIREIVGLPKEEYNPFDYYSWEGSKLYLDFIKINEKEPEQIKTFVNTYGFLGLDQDPYDLLHRILKELHDSQLQRDEQLISAARHEIGHKLLMNVKESLQNKEPIGPAIGKIIIDLTEEKFTFNNDDYLKMQADAAARAMFQPEEEDVQDYVSEIIKMRSIVDIKQAIDDKNSGMLLYHLLLLYERHDYIVSVKDLEDHKDDFAYLQYLAKIRIQDEVNHELRNISPILDWNIEGPKFKGTWMAHSLLSAMYAMLYMDLIGGKIIRKCHNETCNKYFTIYGSDERKIYCDPSCKRSQVQREYRRRVKERSDH